MFAERWICPRLSPVAFYLGRDSPASYAHSYPVLAKVFAAIRQCGLALKAHYANLHTEPQDALAQLSNSSGVIFPGCTSYTNGDGGGQVDFEYIDS